VVDSTWQACIASIATRHGQQAELTVPAWDALQSLINLLKTLPPALIARNHVSLRRPSRGADLPWVVASVAGVADLSTGIGGIVGSHQVSSASWASDTGIVSSGTFLIELWALDEPTLMNIATGVVGVLENSAAAAGAGFGTLTIQSVGPINLTTLDGQPPGSDTGLRLPVGGTFTFEAVSTVQTGPGGIIKQVQVDVKELDTSGVDETMNIP
jgi:hypothetical protein